MQDAGSSSKIWKWVVAAAVILLLNYAWELAHSRLFTNYVNVARIHHALACLQHAFTDLLISSGTYLVTAVAFQRLTWAASARWVWPTLMWLSLGMTVTVGIEIWATSIGRWSLVARLGGELVSEKAASFDHTGVSHFLDRMGKDAA